MVVLMVDVMEVVKVSSWVVSMVALTVGVREF